jgi:SAM-dependent methyltransferase
MQVSRNIRAALRKLLGTRIAGFLRRGFRGRLKGLESYRSLLAGRRGLEIGGPSGLLGDEGFLPIYWVLESIDNCLFSDQTIWTGQAGATYRYHPRKRPGTQLVCEATDLRLVRDQAYECILASHCLEHVANPLRALAEWERVLRADGLLLLILPHKDGNFDWRRPTTTLHHMIEDYEKAIGEDDLTHLPEILRLHDLQKDKAAGSAEQFRRRCMENCSNRAMHHHVFDTPTAVAMVDHAGLQVIRIDNFRPYHIIILCRKSETAPNNARFQAPLAEYRRRSPFPSDHIS